MNRLTAFAVLIWCAILALVGTGVWFAWTPVTTYFWPAEATPANDSSHINGQATCNWVHDLNGQSVIEQWPARENGECYASDAPSEQAKLKGKPVL